MIASARVAAYQVLCSVSAGRVDLSDALAASRASLDDDRDRALAAEIALGVQRWRAALDHVIAHYAKRPLTRLDPEVVEILRLSAYQLLHLTRVPASAVVDDAVKLTGRVGKRSASGLVNAVLRAISRGRDALPLPSRPAQPEDRAATLDFLSITLSHPRWVVERWLDRHGFDATESWLRFNNAPAPLTLRVNRLKNTPEQLIERLDAEDVAVRRARFAPDALVVERGQPLAGRGLADGWFVVQDEASQIVPLLAGDRPGGRILDACASPGGKTTALAGALAGPALNATPGLPGMPGMPGMIVACDVRDRRMALLQRTVAASGATSVRLVQADLLQRLPFAQPFDLVMVDAPCSGLGTLRRDPDIKWKRQASDLPLLADAQLAMLRHAAEVVGPGGRLVYATCSSEPDENEEVTARFLAAAPSFQEVRPEGGPWDQLAGLIDVRGHLRTFPHQHGLEAFFGAVFVRVPGST